MPITSPFHCAFLAEHSNGIVQPKGALTNLRRLCLWVLLLALWSGPFAHADSQGSLEVDGRTRTYKLHVPASYTASEPMPLVLVLHGRLGTGRSTIELTHFDKTSDAHGFMAVFPDGLHRSWADGRGATDSDKDGVNDVHFLSELIHKLLSDYRIDPSRVYVTGISNGGFMSQRVACELADQVAAVGIVAATMGEHTADACRPTKPISVMLLQGSKDPLVPIQGGPMGRNGSRGTILSLEATAQKWVSLDACNSTPESSALPDNAGDGTIVRKQAYSGCKGGSEVIRYAIEGGGHTWPGGKQYLPEMFIGKTTRNLDASEALWDFFSHHAR
jgi:polyhydroxybutyrate depolymerase